MDTKFYNQAIQQSSTPPTPKKYTPYVPQYKLHGIEPDQTYGMTDKRRFNTFNQPMLVKGKPDMFEQKLITPPTNRNVPFAELPSPALSNIITVPNSGNNVETNWTGLNEQIEDDIGLNDLPPNTPMIDNNEYVDVEKYTQSAQPVSSPQVNMPTTISLQDEEYLLAIEGSIIATGSLAFIENEVKELVFGDHQLCDGKAIPAEDLVVLKRIKIKVGVFVDG